MKAFEKSLFFRSRASNQQFAQYYCTRDLGASHDRIQSNRAYPMLIPNAADIPISIGCNKYFRTSERLSGAHTGAASTSES
mmetsp:Transcript_9815/g.26160  ORF Transcript_9815/g.26160 Transcript_9815/m.26160 type:complete len:81 (-) Transcript_9815:121-363(-)